MTCYYFSGIAYIGFPCKKDMMKALQSKISYNGYVLWGKERVRQQPNTPLYKKPTRLSHANEVLINNSRSRGPNHSDRSNYNHRRSQRNRTSYINPRRNHTATLTDNFTNTNANNTNTNNTNERSQLDLIMEKL